MHYTAACAFEANHAALVVQGLGLNDTRVVDHRTQQGVCGACRQKHLAAVGLDQLAVVGQRVDGGLIDAVAQQVAVVDIQGDLVAGRQQGDTQPRGYHAFVAHFRRQQGDVAAVGRRERALVDHGA
ncbi:hypothetical protein D9M73_110830 [compost metagenome]